MPKKYKIISGKDFSAFKLLDPPETLNEQVYIASHVSYGQYHAGVVVNDISTNYEFEVIPFLQMMILEDFEKFLLNCYFELE